MDTTAFRAKVREITENFDRDTANWWEYASASGGAARLLTDVLTRVVLLVGEEPIEIADARLTDDDGAAGAVVIITATRIIRAEFNTAHDAARNMTENVSVEAVPLSAVRVVRAEVAGTSARDDEWPSRARVTLILDRELTGASEIVLPVTARAEHEHAGKVATLAQRLPF